MIVSLPILFDNFPDFYRTDKRKDYLLTKGNIFISHLYDGSPDNKHYYYHKGWNVQAVIAYVAGVVVPFPGTSYFSLRMLSGSGFIFPFVLSTRISGFVGTLGAKVSTTATDIGHLGWLLSFTISFILYYFICICWPTCNQRLIKEMGLGWEDMAAQGQMIEGLDVSDGEPVEVINIKELKA